MGNGGIELQKTLYKHYMNVIQLCLKGIVHLEIDHKLNRPGFEAK